MSHLDVIGRAEQVDLLDLNLKGVPAKVDTGADSSSIWASSVQEINDELHCIFFGPSSPYYTGEVVKISKNFTVTRVANSFGHKELRYKVKLRIRVSGRAVRATFTLSDRSLKTYPILLGRRLLQGKFLVDVSQGKALTKIEKLKAQRLKKELKEMDIPEEIS
ncbi:MAG TPA: RimK/LysX family protein [Candidatus Limnocylindrales bacterium]|nr:RimK/LysX family protein [Candidatus Limnocylindrales bacterium]